MIDAPSGSASLTESAAAVVEGDYRGRFAPSPTGSLHLGNARTALLAWARARVAGGTFIVRVEDIDGPRTRSESIHGNLAELRWLGIDWDEGPDVGGSVGPYLQGERNDLYAAALARLESSGAVFDCYLSRKDALSASSAPHGPAESGQVYGPPQRALNAAVAAERQAAGRAPSRRLSTGTGVVEFSDNIAGPQSFDMATQIGDIVMRRSDGLWAYQLAVSVDDSAMRITEVVRGSDLLASAAAQLLVYRGLGLEPPKFAHVGVLQDEHHHRLSKRGGSLSLHDLARSAVAPERVVGLLAASLGWLETPRPLSAKQLLTEVPREVLGSAGAEPVTLSQADLAYLTRG